MRQNQFLLSILIPTYNYSYGLERILKAFIKLEKSYLAKVEFLISDDSNNVYEVKKIRDICSLYKEKYKFNLTYFEGTKSSNPIDNWNSLILKSNGLYRQIIHHDEFFIYLRIQSLPNIVQDLLHIFRCGGNDASKYLADFQE
jgi:hypothetical protein